MSPRNLVISITLAIFFTWFALANSQTVTLSILIWKYQLSLSLVILISILIGIILTGIISAKEENKLFGKIKELEKQSKPSEKK